MRPLLNTVLTVLFAGLLMTSATVAGPLNLQSQPNFPTTTLVGDGIMGGADFDESQECGESRHACLGDSRRKERNVRNRYRFEREVGVYSRAHMRWCSQNYRSYRSSDNTFLAKRNVRRTCVSPFF